METKVVLIASRYFLQNCDYCDFSPREALEFFMDNISLYTHIAQHDVKIYNLSSKIFTDCLEEGNYEKLPVTEEKKALVLKYIRKIIEIMRSTDPIKKKEFHYSRVIKQWYYKAKGMEPQIIDVARRFLVQVPIDFYLLCESHCIKPVDVLKYYMSKVNVKVGFNSLPEKSLTATSFFMILKTFKEAIAA
jgi:hypothetical protein